MKYIFTIVLIWSSTIAGLAGQSCGLAGASGLIEPQSLNFFRTVTESRLIGVPEFESSGSEYPVLYRKISYTGGWTADYMKICTFCVDLELAKSGGATFAGADIYNITTGDLEYGGQANGGKFGVYQTRGLLDLKPTWLGPLFPGESLYVNPFYKSSQTPTTRVFAKYPSPYECSSTGELQYQLGNGGGGEWRWQGVGLRTNGAPPTITLSERDTYDDALAHAKGRTGKEPKKDNVATAFYSVKGRYVSASKVRAEARYSGGCSGKRFVIEYTMVTTDLEGNLINKETETKTVAYDSNGNYEFEHEYEAKLGEKVELTKLKATLISDCNTDSSNPYFTSSSTGSVHWVQALGRLNPVKSAGTLRLDEEVWDDLEFSPADLTYHNPDPSRIMVIHDASGAIRQIITPGDVVDLAVDEPGISYFVRIYKLEPDWSPDSLSGLYEVEGLPHTQRWIGKVIVEGKSCLQFKDELENGSSRIEEFYYQPDVSFKRMGEYHFSAWTKRDVVEDTSGVRTIVRKEIRAENKNRDIVTAFEIVEDGVGNVLSQVRRQYNEIQAGAGTSSANSTSFYSRFSGITSRQLLREFYYEGSASTWTRSVAYAYVNDTASPSYRRIQSRADSRGDWVRYVYDPNGRLYQEVSAYLGSSPDDPDSLNRVMTYAYYDLDDLNGDGHAESIKEQTLNLLGHDVSRSFELDVSGTVSLGGVSVSEKRFIDAVDPSASWDHSDNLVESVWEYADPESEFYGDVYASSHVDGTGRIWKAVRQEDGSIEITDARGALNDVSAPTTVLAGTLTVKHADQFGVLLDEVVVDVESGLVVAQTFYSDFDSYGRAQRLDYLDGTYGTRFFACCGLESVTGRDGLITTYAYDDLKRVEYTTTAAGTDSQQIMRKVFDAAGNLKKYFVGPDEATLSLVAEYDYDYSGRQLASRSRYLDAAPSMSRQTTISEVLDSGYLVSTTTYPNGSTLIEKFYPDGFLYETGGTAAQQVRYTQGVEVDATLGYAVRTETQTYLHSDGSLSAEYVKTYLDALGRVYKTETPAAGGGIAVTRNVYNLKGQLKSTEDPDGLVLLYAYSMDGKREITALDVNGNGEIDYGGSDRISRNRRKITTRSEQEGTYSVLRRTSEVWEVEGADTSRVVSQNDTTIGALANGEIGTISWSTVYDQTAVTRSLIDRENLRRVITSIFPDSSYQVEVVASGLRESSTRYDRDDIVLSQQTFEYDRASENRLEVVSDLYLGRTSYEYYGDGQLKSVTTPDPDLSQGGEGYDPQTMSYSYTDDVALISRVATLPDMSTVTEHFYPTGKLKEKRGSLTYPVAYTYDYAGRLRTLATWKDRSAESESVLTAWEYYANGLPKQKWYDADVTNDGGIGGMEGPVYTYTSAGRLATKTNARGTVTTYSYHSGSWDLSGIAYEDALTPSVNYPLYDRLGRVEVIADGSGSRTLSYKCGQLLSETYTSGVLEGYAVDRHLDELNRQDRLSLTSGSLEPYRVGYAYDSASRLQSVSYGSHSVTYGYDPTSELRETRVFNNGSRDVLGVEERRDNLNRLRSVATDNLQLGTSDSHDYLYNELNQRTRHTRGDGSYWSYAYDALGQLEQAVRYNRNAVPMPGYNYGYLFDDIGNRVETETNGRPSSYKSNNLNQYEEREVPRVLDVRGTAVAGSTVTVNDFPVTRQEEAFYHALDVSDGGDAAQQVEVRVTATLPDGGDNNAPRIAEAEKSEYLPPNPERFKYDADGNLIQDGKWSYVWNAENRLIQMETLAIAYNAGAPRQKLEFKYDSQGRRFSRKLSQWDDSILAWKQLQEVRFLYDGWNLIYEQIVDSENGPGYNTYVWGKDLSGSMQGAGGVGGLLAVTTSDTGSTFYPAYDGNGNVVAYYDSQTAEAVANFNYTPFGECLSPPVNQQGLSFRFSTKYQDPASGLLYYGFRYYDLGGGRWLNRDTIGEGGGLNLYAMVGNDFISKWDYLGLNSSSARERSFESRRRMRTALKKTECDDLLRLLLLARLSAATYDGVPTPYGWKALHKTDPSSGLSYSIFSGPNGENVIGFRGTDMTEFADWLSNLRQGTGGNARQYAQVYALDQLANDYPNAEIIGHSLGGGLASYFGIKHQRKTTTFNAAGLHKYSLGQVGSTRIDARKYVDAYYVYGEVLNLGQDVVGNSLLDYIPSPLPALNDLGPNAVGVRHGLWPDLADNEQLKNVSITGFIPGRSLMKLGELSIELHSMNEVIQAIQARLLKECCL